MGAGYIADKTGLTKKVDTLTDKTNPFQQVGGWGATALEALAPLPGGSATKAETAVGDLLKSSANKDYSRVLGATTKANKARSAAVVPGLIDEGMTAFTTKGLQQKVSAKMSEAGQKLEDAYEALPPGASIPLNDVTAKLSQVAKDTFTIGKNEIPMSSVADTGVKNIEDLKQRLLGISKPGPNGRVIEVDDARRIRQYYDQVAKMAGRYEGVALADQSAAAAHGMAADAIRGELAKQFPDIAAINKQFSFWADTNRVLTDTLLRRQGQAKPMGRKIAQAAGMGAGFVGAGPKGALLGREAMDALEAITTSPGWQTMSAVGKYKLANAVATGSAPTIRGVGLALLRSSPSVPPIPQINPQPMPPQ